jgi:hypothetical protein
VDPVEISQCEDRVPEGSFQVFNSFDDVHGSALTHDQNLTFIVIEARTRRPSPGVTGQYWHINSGKSSFFPRVSVDTPFVSLSEFP